MFPPNYNFLLFKYYKGGLVKLGEMWDQKLCYMKRTNHSNCKPRMLKKNWIFKKIKVEK